MDAILIALYQVLDIVLGLLVWALIISAVLSWLVHFNIVNTTNPVVATIGGFLYRLTEPLLQPIRRILPDLGGIDLAPVALILLIFFIRSVLGQWMHASMM